MPSAMPAAIAITFFNAPGDFAADHVVVAVHAERRGREQRLQFFGDGLVIEGDDRGRRRTLQHFLGEVGPGQHAGGMIRARRRR